MEQWSARQSVTLEIAGSSPVGTAIGSVAQSVEQRTENPCVAGSIPARATRLFPKIFKLVNYVEGLHFFLPI